MKKPIIAALLALLMTACVGAAIFAIGGAAVLNKNSVPVSNSASAGGTTAVISAPQTTNQVAQLQNLISQYQDREKQYQQREQQLQNQLSQTNAQLQEAQQTVQQAQMLLQALQQRGVIRVTNDGRIFIN
jgi:TolA-binding protein